MTDCRIYAACLASYNSGILHGKWIDCDGKDGDGLRAEIAALLRTSPEPNVMVTDPDTGEQVPSAEEWAIHDHEGFGGLITSEWPDLDEVAEAAEVLAGDNEDLRRGLLWLVTDRGCSIRDAIDQCDEVSTYTSDAHDLLADYAQERAEDIGPKIENWPYNHIDWAAAGRELNMSGDVDLCDLDGQRFIVTNAAAF